MSDSESSVASDIDFLFDPSSVAVVGASAVPGKWGCTIVQNLIAAGFEGALYPINPKRGTMHGLTAYASVTDLDGPIDLAIIGVPATSVPRVMDDCARKGVKGAVIVTAGFAEIGESGLALEQDVMTRARSGGVRVVGPNCLGLSSTSSNLNASLLPYTPGSLALVSQSGNVTVELQLLARRRGLGFSRYVSIGNQADVQIHECVSAFGADPQSDVILLFVESLRDGRAFLDTARRVSTEKPIVALKVGTSPTGTRAALSHTGSLAGTDAVYDAAFRQAGVIRVTSIGDLIDVGEALAVLPPMAGTRVAILTDGGGHGTVAADACARHGLDVVMLPDPTRARLAESMLPQSHTSNPVDFAGAAEADLWSYVRVAELLVQEPTVDALVIVGALFGGYGELFDQADLEVAVAHALGEVARNGAKPVVLHTPYLFEHSESIVALKRGGIPVYLSAETAVTCLAKHAEYCESRRRIRSSMEVTVPPVDAGLEALAARTSATLDGRAPLADHEASEILRALGLPAPKAKLARDVDEAVAAAMAIGWPVVAKICSPDIVHKSDAGGVSGALSNAAELAEAFETIRTNAFSFNNQARVDGVTIHEWLQQGVELVIGGHRDPQFGPVMMFGLGGIMVEVLKDVTFRVAPVSAHEARDMVEEIRGFSVLEGTRARPGCDIDAIVDVLVLVSTFLSEAATLVELDLNPVIAYETGVRIADVRMVVTPT